VKPEAVNLEAALARVDEMFSPRIVAYYNDSKIMVGKLDREFVWHAHPDTDDLFLVLKGCMKVQLRDGDVEVGPGELFVVPQGVEHCPTADEETHLLLIETRGTPNTGDSGVEPVPEREL
jgi:mannose-6-phosphate isomerase-like protein (cupin superfamily)